MGNTVSSISQSIGDVFWTDNPNRRSRAFQLQHDAQDYLDQYNRDKSDLDTREEKLRTKMNNYLQKHGYNSLSDLDKVVQSKLVGDALDNWKKIAAEANANNIFSQVLMTISGVGLVVGAVGIGALVLIGVMSGPVGWAALGIIFEITAIIGVFALVTSIIQGSEERDKLRQAINDLSVARLKTYFARRSVTVYSRWVANFDTFFDNDLPPEVIGKAFDSQFSANIKTDFGAVTYESCWDELHQLDQNRNAWTNEDPSKDSTVNAASAAPKPSSLMAMSVVNNTLAAPPEIKPIQTVAFKPEGAQEVLSMRLQLELAVSRASCVVQDIEKSTTWALQGNLSPDIKEDDVISLADARFTLINLNDFTTVLKNCTAQFA